MSRKRLKTVVVLLALVLAICLAVMKIHESNRKAEQQAEQEKAAKKAARLDQKRRIDRLALRTNAVTKWREEFPGSGLRFLFTADVARVLVRPDGRPVLFRDAEALDVARRGQDYVCCFGIRLKTLHTMNTTTARLALACEPSMAQEILSRGEGETYAVVARISAVPSYDEVVTNDSSGESSTERRFAVLGTELGQEPVASDYGKSMDELLKTLGLPHPGPDE